MTELGMRWGSRGDGGSPVEDETVATPVNTRTSLWSQRWPSIALQSCIDEVEQAAPEKRSEVKWDLPCQTCPENTRCLNAKRKELGPLMYDREILTNPRSSESSLFPRDVFRHLLRPQEDLVRHWRPPFSLEHEYAVCQAWDLAWSERIGGDYLVCATAYVHKPSGTRHLLDVERWQRVSFDGQVRLIEEKWRQFEADLVVIESDASQQIWTQHMAANTAVPVLPHSAGDKKDLQAGVPGLLITFENQKWEIPYRAGSYHHDEVVNLLDEFEAFGWNDGKLEGVGEHDDAVMAMYHLEWGCQRLLYWGDGASQQYRGVVPGAR